MHPNPAFRGEEIAENLDFARHRGFGVLTATGPQGILASHVPFRLDDSNAWADIHLVRSNPIVQVDDGPALLIVSGPDGYVSPDWYEVPDQVPTWNYVAVHLRGHLQRRPDAEMHALLDAQSAHFVEMLLQKSPWTTAKMTPEVLTRMMRQIVPFTFHVEDVQGTWKLNQNKPDDVRLRAANAMAEDGIGTETQALSDLMRAATKE